MKAQFQPTVYVVDDDPAARRVIAGLLRSKHVPAEAFASAEEFLANYDGSIGCLITDVQMPGMTGLDLQRTLKERGMQLPVIVISAYADVPTAVLAMKEGAVGFLEKPWRDDELWSNVKAALEIAAGRQQQENHAAELQARLSDLTPDEQRILHELVAGKPNKAIAAELDIGLRTVELRRSKIFKKMQAGSLAELIQMALLARHEHRHARD